MIINNFQKQTQNALKHLKDELASVRANRPTPALIENISVEYYGNRLPIKQLGSIGIVPPRELIIQVWDKTALPPIAKAIESSSLGLSSTTEGNTVKIFLPELSRERREELIRHVKKETEKIRIEIRHLRDETNKKVEEMLRVKEIGEDQKFKLKDSIQKETDKTNEEIEKLLNNKIKEINE